MSRVREVVGLAGVAPWVCVAGSTLMLLSLALDSDTVRMIAVVVVLTGVVASLFNIRRLRRALRGSKAQRQEWS